ncbi:N-acetylmuramoyl-L-alanine amidase [Chitinophaga oryzae]|uniref:N-acetylmuramoyl-L-alanine amidase n=1 Tax=Chitinophaga oryzae TaxID=2725414 RepID=A0AAE6ZHH3_9BACT|nr:N-acetylmuramoyl-L-alanine amidase [Chitinophaga oryzae]QJB31549.1 N-acetylmuramoyl-L-alanine amidase [Chitinophaga oryzae]QJB38029.1 N-acetylmuramoyl-L-alanine amidase [Chitinophaga oryzae]
MSKVLKAEITKVETAGIQQEFYGKMLDASPLKVMLDPGHGDQYISKKTGKLIAVVDPGAVANDGKTYEKDITLLVCNSIKKYLDAFGVANAMTRTGDLKNAGKKLEWRIQKALDVAADFFLCIHVDAAGVPNKAAGTSVFYCKGDEKQQAFAQAIMDEITLFEKRGVKDDTQTQHPRLYVLREFNKEKKEGAALVELAFLDNDKELKIIQEQHDQIGKEIATGVYKHIFKKAPAETPKEQKSSFFIDFFQMPKL